MIFMRLFQLLQLQRPVGDRLRLQELPLRPLEDHEEPREHLGPEDPHVALPSLSEEPPPPKPKLEGVLPC